MGTESRSSSFTISKKVVYGIAVIAVVIVAVVLIYFRPFSTTNANDVKIESFAKEEGYMIGGSMEFPFTVKVTNFGSNDVSGLVLVVKVLGDYNEVDSDVEHLGTLRSGYSTTVSMLCSANYDASLKGKEVSYVATLQLDSTVLDESRLP